MGDRSKPRHSSGESVFRDASSSQRPRHLVDRRPRALFKAIELPCYGNQRANHRMGFTDTISAISRTTPAGGLCAPCGRSKHGGVLALAFTPLRTRDLLEGGSLARSAA